MGKGPKPCAVSIKDAALLLGVTPDVIRKGIKNKVFTASKISERKTVIPISEIARVLRISEGDIFR